MKEGPLFIHRTKGKGPLTSSSFKKLHFFLTTEALSFAKTPSSKVGKRRKAGEWGGGGWGRLEHPGDTWALPLRCAARLLASVLLVS